MHADQKVFISNVTFMNVISDSLTEITQIAIL